jgi:hypothetical protein
VMPAIQHSWVVDANERKCLTIEGIIDTAVYQYVLKILFMSF